MKKLILGLVVLFSMNSLAQKQKIVVTQDISNFWNAYDRIVLTKDSLQQIELITKLYIGKGTPGLAGIMQVKRYSVQEYINAINQYPKFWSSVRDNTLKADEYAGKIEQGIKKLKQIYPVLKPANIYFTIGILRTGGTTLDNKVLIGSEVAMTDKKTISSEFDKRYPNLRRYFDTDPVKGNIAFLNVHEYIHTQQKLSSSYSLIAQTMVEGVAEFVTAKALAIQSPNPQIKYGKTIDEKLKREFVKNMFARDFSKWLWNSPENEFGMGDLGYYIGYAICEKYYNLSKDKKKAVKEMIQLDYGNENDLFKIVDRTAYFDKSLTSLKTEFEEKRPKVVRIEQFENGSQQVNPGIKVVTLHFSQPMNTKDSDFDYGPLGKENVLWVQKVIGFSEDKKSFSFQINMEPGKQYQLVADDFFKDENGYSLKPFLIDFRTAK